jgi:hypothetical protein
VAGFVPAPKPSKPQPAQSNKVMTTVSVKGTVSQYAQMMADPLNAPVVGRPDSNAMATNTTRIRDVYDVLSSATGYAAALVTAHTNLSYSVPAITAGGDVNWTTVTQGSSQFQTQLNADNVGCRTLAMVVEWEPSQSATVMAGRAALAQYPINAHPSMVNGNVTSYFDDDGIAFPATQFATTISRPWLDNKFIGTSDSQEHVPTVAFVATGLPFNVVVGQIVVTRVIELLPRGMVLARMSATHTVCDPGACCQASNLVGRNVTFAYGARPSADLAQAGLKLVRAIAQKVAPWVTGAAELLAMVSK